MYNHNLLVFIILIIVILVHLYSSLKNNRYRVLKNEILDKENRFNSTWAIQEEKINQLKKYNEQLFEITQKNKHEEVGEIKLKILTLMNDLITKQNSIQEYKELEQCAFLYYLKKKHPLLSDTDLRHCLFVLLEYSLKETSQVLSININTVKTSRYRARKKIKIPKNITLKRYLQNFNQNINRNYA